MKIVAGTAILVFFAVFFALPVYAAMTLCAMPCCAKTGTAISTGMTECATTCTIRADQAAPSRTTTLVPEQQLDVSPATPVVETHARHTIATASCAESHRASETSLHLLNSLFRI